MKRSGKSAFPWCTALSEDDAKVIVFGVKDESGSRAERKGSSAGPDAARSVSVRRDLIKRRRHADSMMYTGVEAFPVNAYDSGNVAKAEVAAFARRHASKKKVLGCIGGDHSITYEILKGIDRCVDSWGFVYVDAHPDIIGSAGRYYGSVVNDICMLKNVEPGASFIVGARAIEAEEARNIKDFGIRVIGIDKIIKDGIVATVNSIKNLLPENLYLSIDLDSVDPAFAPGVSTPVPGGLASRELLYIASTIGSSVNLGFDVMELVPRYDLEGITAHLASLVLMDVAACVKRRA